MTAIKSLMIFCAVVLMSSATFAADSARPNVVLILCDDLGYAELGCYGQLKIRTPNIDRLAAEGMRFTQYYSGSPVCAPSRCVLLTGKHTGHAAVRNNKEVRPEGQHPLPASEVTLAELLKSAGYRTAAVGKWGLGPPGSQGDPLTQGFDSFFGYNCQRHAHNHFPEYLYRNDKRVPLEGNDGGDTGQQYSHDLFEKEALTVISSSRERPFFLYLALTIPHLALQVPEDSLAEYNGKWDDPAYTGGKGYRPHAHPRAAYAAMISRMDRSVGRIVDRLNELDLSKKTLVVVTSDNGPTYNRLGGSDSEFFRSAGDLRGFKGSVYEGGIRIPLIARWPGTIKPGKTSEFPCAAYDLLPTVCELAGVAPPKSIDGLSIVPTLLARGDQKHHDFLYWEFPAYGGQQAVRMGKWKGVRQRLAQGRTKIELFDLSTDPAENNDVSGKHPGVVTRIAAIMAKEHTTSEVFPLQSVDVARAAQ
jgi:arylsulfatase A